jgi:hypothetical protein
VVTGCESEKNGHRFVNLRKHLCFWLFMQQRKIFSSNKMTAIPEQLQNTPENSRTVNIYIFYSYSPYPYLFYPLQTVLLGRL